MSLPLTLNTVRTGSVGNCYVLKCGEHSLILDCGVNYKEILKAADYETIGIDAVLVTHVHGDHVSGVKYWLTMGVPVYSCKEVCEAYPGVEFLKSKFVRRRGAWAIIPFHVPHDATENYGYLIKCPNGEQLLYATDFAFIKDRFTSYKIEHFLLECNYMEYSDIHDDEKGEHVLHGHAPLSVVKDFLKTNLSENTKTVTICHLSKENADRKKILAEIRSIMPENIKVSIAERGKTEILCEGEKNDIRGESTGDI